jgi:radical SAM protein (TIGR01212 family)
MEVLEETAHRTYLTVELGMQTCHDRTLEFINRGYLHEKFKEGFEKLKSRKIRTCVHIIDGLPGESFEDMMETAREVALLHPEGLKIQLLHVIAGTPLESLYRAKVFNTLTMEEYIKTVCTQLRYIPSDVVIERITGDGDRSKLVAPLWSASKIEVLNGIDRYLRENNIWQGDRASGQDPFHA